MTTCAACGAPGVEPWASVRGFDVARCRACGHGQVENPPPDPATIYDEGYFEGGASDGYASYGATEPVLRAEFRRTLGRIGRHARPERAGARGRLVEIGCAYGVFLDEARARFDTFGVEVSEAAAARARERGLDVVTGEPTAELLRARGPFDAAAMLDVIEHLASPERALYALAGATTPKAPLVVTTGDFGSIGARALGERWRLLTPPQHLHFFTRRSLEALLWRTGFEVVEVRHPTKRVPVRLAAYQLARAAGPASRALQRVAARVPGWLGAPVNLFDAMQVIALRRG